MGQLWSHGAALEPWGQALWARLPWEEVLVPCWELCLCRQRAEAEELRRQLEANSSALTRALRDEYAKEKEDQERRHQVWFPLTCSPSGAGTTKPQTPQGQLQPAQDSPRAELLFSLLLTGRTEGAEGPAGAGEAGLGGQLCEEGGNGKSCPPKVPPHGL